MFFTVGSAFAAEDVFLTLTKYNESFEKLPTNVTVISNEKIEESHAENLAEILQNENGIFFGGYGMNGVEPFLLTRGASSSAQTLVLIDGRRINSLAYGKASIAAIPASIIERVEIIRGAGASVYGTGAFGGVINVITKKAAQESPIADAGIAYGSFNSFNPYVIGAYATDMFGTLAAFSYNRTDGHRKNSEYESNNIFFNGYVNRGAMSTLSITGNIYNDRYGVPGSTSWRSYTEETKDSNKYIKADYNISFEDGNSLSLSAYYANDFLEDRPDRRNSHYRIENDGSTYGLQADFHYQDILLFGIEWWKEDFNNDSVSAGWMPGDPDYVTSIDKSRESYAGYMQFIYDFWKFRIIPAIRGDHNSQYGDVFSPSISAIFNLNDNIKFSANTGKVWRAPTYIDVYYPGSENPDLKAEYGVSSDIGVEYTNNKVRLSGTGFYIKTDDLLVWDNATYRMENIDETVQYGLEFEAGYIMSKIFSHDLNYTFLKAENDKTDKILRYSPEHSVSYTLGVKPLESLKISAAASYKDKYYNDNSEATEMDGFFTLNLNINYKLNEMLSFWVKGLNITNSDYEIVDGYPMPGATVYGGVSVKIWK